MLDRLGHVNHDIDNAMRKVSFHITGFTPSQAHTDPNHNGPSLCRTPAGCTAGSFPSVASPPSMAVSPPSVCPSPSTCVLQSCTASVSKYNLCASPSLPLASWPFPSVSNSVLAFASTVGLGLPLLIGLKLLHLILVPSGRLQNLSPFPTLALASTASLSSSSLSGPGGGG